MGKWFIGIDLGGTFIKFAAIDDERNVTSTFQLPTPQDGSSDAVIGQMLTGVRQLIDEESFSYDQIEAVGIGVPGPLDISAGITHAMPNIPGMERVPLREKISSQLKKPVFLENDANAAAFGEYMLGAGRGTSSMVLLTLGTGIGGGIVLDGKVLHGSHEMGAELGHMIVDSQGRQCPCGQRGCLEQYCSATNLSKAAQQTISSSDVESSLKQVLAEKGSIDARDVNAAAKAGDAVAAEIWDQAARFLAIGCVNICRIIDPDRIILAGGMARAGEDLLGPVCSHFTSLHWHLTDQKTRIMLAELGSDAGVIGAAGVAWAGSQ